MIKKKLLTAKDGSSKCYLDYNLEYKEKKGERG